MQTEEKPIKLGPSVTDIYFSISSQSSVQEGVNLLGRYLRTTRHHAQAKARIKPIELEVPGLLCLAVNPSPKEGFADFGEGLVFSTLKMTRKFPASLTLQENPRIEVTFNNPTALKFEMATFLKDFYAFEIKDTGELERKYFLTQAEIDSLRAASDSQNRFEEEAEKQRNELEEMLVEDPHLQENAPSVQEDFSNIPEGQNIFEQMEVEGQAEEEIVKAKLIEHEGQRDQTASTVNTMPKYSDLPTDISDRRVELEKENERLKTEKSVAEERIASLEEEDRKKTDRISHLERENKDQTEKVAALEKQNTSQSGRISQLETEDQTLQTQVSNLQQQLQALTTQFTELQAQYTSLEAAGAVKKKRIKLNSGEPLQSSQQAPVINQEDSKSGEHYSLELGGQQQDNVDIDMDMDLGNRIGQNAEAIKPKDPIVLSAIESIDHYQTRGLSAGVIDLFIELCCVSKVVQIYESSKWESLNTHENVSVPADCSYENKKFLLYPLHLKAGDKQYWSLLILRNSKKWDETAIINAYYLSSIDHEPPKDLLKKVLKHVSDSVKKRLTQKEPKANRPTFQYGTELVPLPLGNIKLIRVSVSKSNNFEETGFHLLNWLHSAVVKSKSFFDELSKPANYIRHYEAEENVVGKWKNEIHKHLEKHLYKPVSVQTEKRLTRSTQKLDTTISRPNRDPNQNAKQKSKAVLNQFH